MGSPPRQRKVGPKQRLKGGAILIIPGGKQVMRAVKVNERRMKKLKHVVRDQLQLRPMNIPHGFSAPKHMTASREASKVLALTNAARARRGLPRLRFDACLIAAAKSHTLDQAFRKRAMSHRGSDGSNVGTRVMRKGYKYRYAAENVAHGHVCAEHVFRSWMRSPGHRRNILNRRSRDMGLYVCKGFDGRLFWTQVFGLRR